MIKQLLLCFTFLVFSITQAQNTVGTISITENVFNAYTLISVHTDAYLINNCGEVINQWNSTYLPGNAVYLLPNGNLLRAGRLEDGSSNIQFGGQGGIIELFDWDGNIIWSFTYSTNDFRQHHDVFPMTNGNILVLAATLLTENEAIAAGRDPNSLSQSNLYSEQVIEVEPIGTSQANIVWEWNAEDHFIQDFDNTKANFGDVALSPGKIDINFLNGGSGGSNWLHFNSVQYDENLDQIVLSSRNLSEIYIIDHSTTTAEASTNSGGTYGNGGDFLYRWGNPQAYRQGTETDRILYGQHYPYFISDGLNDAGKLMIFNNGNGRTPEFSEVLIINPPVTSPGVYTYVSDTAFGPESIDYTYSDSSDTPSSFYSAILSSAQRLPNGNTLICEGRSGEIFEIDNNENVVWEYVNPINNSDGSISVQGTMPSNANLLFRAIKYPLDFPGFVGRDLTPQQPLELNPNISACQALSSGDFNASNFIVYPNPTSDVIRITSVHMIDKIELYSILGKKINEVHRSNSLDLSAFNSGIYFLQIHSEEKTISKKIIKQ